MRRRFTALRACRNNLVPITSLDPQRPGRWLRILITPEVTQELLQQGGLHL